jgi:RNA polymerase sigma factor (sigma-70 family)
MNDDLTLLRRFTEENSEAAFAEIVARHVNLVYSVAWRQVRDAGLAGEITQAVFIILSRKAKSFNDQTILSSWLCRTVRYAGANALTIQRRRQRREQEAQNIMNETASETDLQETWSQIAPQLDAALEQLPGKDHDALVLRFFENKSFSEVAATLGVSEGSAKMRVGRALEKLRKFFAGHGIGSTTAILAGSISANSVQAAPVALVKSVTTLAVTKGAVVSSSTTTLIKGALKIMAWTKMKFAVAVGAGVLLAAGGGAAVYEIDQHSSETPAASVSADDPVDPKINWLLGKKYSMAMDLSQSMETTVPGQPLPVKTLTHVRQDMDFSPLKKTDDGWRLELKFTDASLSSQQNGATAVSYDSSQNSPADPNSPAALLGLVVGAPLEYDVNARGIVQKIEGLDQFSKQIAAAKPMQQILFHQLFNENLLKQYASFGIGLPSHPVKIGESWSVKTDMDSNAGNLALNMEYTFKNWESHSERRCAHFTITGRISSNNPSTATGAAIEIRKGDVTGDMWFDPALGMIVDTETSQSLALKIFTQTQTLTPQMDQKVSWSLVDVE